MLSRAKHLIFAMWQRLKVVGTFVLLMISDKNVEECSFASLRINCATGAS
jgi:hypothetical protein